MQTSLRIDGANCPTCFNQALDDLGRLDGVRTVHGSIGGPCIEIDHRDDIEVDLLAQTIRNRLHGIEMFANEVRMVPLEPIALPTQCTHHRGVEALDSDSKATSAHADVIDPAMTLGEIVTLHPSLASELERHGLDYCCHGDRTLATATAEAGLQLETVIEELSAARVDEPKAPWASLGQVELADHIEAVHHRYLWAELPRISALVDKIVGVHSDRHPELADVQRLYTELRADLEPHLRREEHELFPLIRQHASPDSRTGGVAEQIAALVAEHETVGALLEELKSVTDGYTPPSDACASYTACYRALEVLEADTHQHVHKESNVLFPMVVGSHDARHRAIVRTESLARRH